MRREDTHSDGGRSMNVGMVIGKSGSASGPTPTASMTTVAGIRVRVLIPTLRMQIISRYCKRKKSVYHDCRI